MSTLTTLTGSRIPELNDPADLAAIIANLGFDLDHRAVPRFGTNSQRDSAYAAWVLAGGTMQGGMTCTVAGLHHVYDVTGVWRYSLRKHVSGTTDGSGYLVVNHGLGVKPNGCHLTVGPQATPLLERVLTLNWSSADVNNITIYAHRSDQTIGLASNLIQFSMEAFV